MAAAREEEKFLDQPQCIRYLVCKNQQVINCYLLLERLRNYLIDTFCQQMAELLLISVL